MLMRSYHQVKLCITKYFNKSFVDQHSHDLELDACVLDIYLDVIYYPRSTWIESFTIKGKINTF